MLPVAPAGLLAVSLGLIALALALAALAWWETGDRAGRFLRCYTTVNGRVVEGAYWAYVQARLALRGDRSEDRAITAGFAGLVTLYGLLGPVCVIFAGERPELAEHGVPLGAGALLWACLLESAGLRERVSKLRRDREPPRAEQTWKWPATLVVADLLLAVPALSQSSASKLGAMIAGAWFVALADLVSVGVGFLLCPWEPYPLDDPPTTTAAG